MQYTYMAIKMHSFCTIIVDLCFLILLLCSKISLSVPCPLIVYMLGNVGYS